MKNVPIHYARTLIIARIAATIIPTPIDFNNLIMIIRVFKSRIYSFIVYVCLCFSIFGYKEKQKTINECQQRSLLTFYFSKNHGNKKGEDQFLRLFCFHDGN